ncbi:MAG: hypothetical protein K9I59_07425 [Chlorobium sp.]|nr:hypothetical protein [Chlorobium sp.]
MNVLPEHIKQQVTMKPRQSISRSRPGGRHFWWQWMVFASWGVIATGLAMVVLPDVMNRFFSLLFFSVKDHYPSFGKPASDYITFAHGMLGSVMAGWGVALLGVLYGPFRSGSPDGWRSVAYSVILWFALDTSVSLAYGLWQNALLNLIIAELYVIPLVATFRQFFEKSGATTQSRKKSQ